MGIRRSLSILAILVSITDWSVSQQYTPGDTWRESLPEEQGVDSRSLVECSSSSAGDKYPSITSWSSGMATSF
jgi:hypothetical protein